MTTNDEVSRQAKARARQIRELVEELGSVAAVADHLGISAQRVYQIIGPGGVQHFVDVTCQDCGRPARARRAEPPRCYRCKQYFARHGQPWSRQRIDDARYRPPRKTHCKHGHRLSEENLYISPKGHPKCRACQAERNRRIQARETTPVRQPATAPARRDGLTTGSE